MGPDELRKAPGRMKHPKPMMEPRAKDPTWSRFKIVLKR